MPSTAVAMPAQIEVDLLPQEGIVFLHRHGGRQVLLDVRTMETCKLPPCGVWQLRFAEGGPAFVSRAQEVQWVADLVSEPVYCDMAPGQQCTVVGDNDARIWVSDLLRRMVVDVSVTIRSAPVGEVTSRIFGWDRGRHGCRLRWGALDVYHELRLTAQKGKAFKFCEHGWGRWRAMAVGLWLPSEHLVRRVDQEAVAQGAAGDGGGAADFRALSSHALVALLARWSSRHRQRGGLEDEGDCVAVGGLLRTLIGSAVEGRRTIITIFQDKLATWVPPKVPAGERPLDIPIVDGCFELSVLRDAQCPCCRGLSSLLFELLGSKTVSLVDCLVALLDHCGTTRGKDEAEWFVRQLVWAVGVPRR